VSLFLRYDPPVTEQWTPFSGQTPSEPFLEHVRDLWTLQGIMSTCTAAIWRNNFGLELRIEHGRRADRIAVVTRREAPLLLIPNELKANLIEQGWFEPPNAN
jgi:hypothetical protein